MHRTAAASASHSTARMIVRPTKNSPDYGTKNVRSVRGCGSGRLIPEDRYIVVDPVSAVVNCDFEAAEALRGRLSRQQVSDVVTLYHDTSDWNQKDIAVHLLQDCEPAVVEIVMRDALHSPTAETRAIALCSLKNDFGMFETFLRNGFVDAALVDEAIRSEADI